MASLNPTPLSLTMNSSKCDCSSDCVPSEFICIWIFGSLKASIVIVFCSDFVSSKDWMELITVSKRGHSALFCASLICPTCPATLTVICIGTASFLLVSIRLGMSSHPTHTSMPSFLYSSSNKELFRQKWILHHNLCIHFLVQHFH